MGSRTSHQLTSVPVVLFLVGVVFLAGCSIIPQPSHNKPDPLITPIVSSVQPARIMQLCVDTNPLFPDSLFKPAVASVSDMLEAGVNVNEGAWQVFISYITSHSYLKDAFSFDVRAIDADDQPALSPTPHPASYNNSYDYANAVATVTSANATAVSMSQEQLRRNHEKLAAVRALVKRYADRLRSLPNIFDATGEDVTGCLQSASQRFAVAGFHGRKTLIIASPLVNMVNYANGIDLSGATVEIIFKSCALTSADACIAANSAWKQRLLSFHASSVSILDPQQSLVENPTF